MLKVVLFVVILIFGSLWIASFIITKSVEQEFPPIGEFSTVNGAEMHYVDVSDHSKKDATAIVFIHGAGSNLRDPMAIYRAKLEDRFRLIFLDRPGHGYSRSFSNSNDPKAQATAIDGLLDDLGIQKAIVVGHSFGGVVAAAYGVLHPKRAAGLVFLAPVSHPWGTGVDWTYDVGNTPLIGWLFSRLVVPVAGNFVYSKAIKKVFAPNTMPSDFPQKSGTRLAIRPGNFHENAKDVARVDIHVESFHPRYKEIKIPTVIFHGDKDDIVSLPIHSINGLSKDIEGAKLFVLEGVGHKPDYVAADRVVEEIVEIAAGS